MVNNPVRLQRISATLAIYFWCYFCAILLYGGMKFFIGIHIAPIDTLAELTGSALVPYSMGWVIAKMINFFSTKISFHILWLMSSSFSIVIMLIGQLRAEGRLEELIAFPLALMLVLVGVFYYFLTDKSKNSSIKNIRNSSNELENVLENRGNDDYKKLQQSAPIEARGEIQKSLTQLNEADTAYKPHHQSISENLNYPTTSKSELNIRSKGQSLKNLPLSELSYIAMPNKLIDTVRNQDFDKAVMFFPHLRLHYDSLKNYGPAVQEEFANLVIEQKSFEDSETVLQTLQVAELERLFGSDKALQSHGKMLIEDGRIEEAIELMHTVRVMGNTVDARKIIQTLDWKREISPQEIKQLADTVLDYRYNNKAETRVVYLAVLSNEKIIGWNPETDLYEVFDSYNDYSQKTKLNVSNFRFCWEDSHRLKFIEVVGKIKIPPNRAASPIIEEQSQDKWQHNLEYIHDGSIKTLMYYSTIVTLETGTSATRRIYLAELLDGKIAGYNPRTLRYEFFTSSTEYSTKTNIFYGHFSISRKKEDRVDFLKQLRNSL